jgi:hypothetical protein|tara:strand:- start:1490 stop:2698 length:1209 start_codon:yes stop_codon:yes gene_type:complete
MGWLKKKLKKAFKSVKKVFKKIGKGIKKAFGKVGEFFGKFGVLGQIGMMFLMPYAAGALGGLLSGAMGQIGTWSAQLLTNGGWAGKALGHTLKAIHTAGTFAGKVYTTISDGIGNAVDRVGNWVSGNGFELSGDRVSIFDRTSKRSLLETGEYDVVKRYGAKSTTTTPTPVVTGDTSSVSTDGTVSGTPPSEMNNVMTDDLSIIENGDVNPLDNNVVDAEVVVPRSEVQVERNILDPDPKVVDNRSYIDMVKDDGIISATGEVISQGIDDFKNITPGEIAEKVTSRVEAMPLDAMTMAGTQEMAKGLGWEVGDQNTSVFYMTNKVDPVSNPQVYDQVDLMAKTTGNAFYGDSFRTGINYMNDVIMPDNSAYHNTWLNRATDMSFRAGQFYQSPAVGGYYGSV